MSDRERKLESMGYALSKTLSAGAIYRPVAVDGKTIYVSGCVPFDGDKNLASKGKVPSQVSLEDARKAAALCAANVLRLVRQELGSLDRVERVLRVTGYVNSDPDFTDQHLVINGASQLLLDVLKKPLESTFVVIEEVDTDNWGWGGLPALAYRKKLTKERASSAG